MMEIKYPETLYCPSCKAEIRLDLSGTVAKTSGLLNFSVDIPYSLYSAKDARRNKQDLKYYAREFIICQSCHTIISAGYA